MSLIRYAKNIWTIRFFWAHLVLSDIRFKYRRSYLGLGWAMIQPFALTLLFSFVMGRFFKVPMENYAPFIFSGLIFWEYITSSIITGCHSFINAEGYIKQFSHPLLIYSLRNVIVCTINLLIAFIGLTIWVFFWQASNIQITWISLIFSFPLLVLFVWPISSIAAFLTVKFRDFSQLIIIILQALYFVSPVLFQPKLFLSSNLSVLLTYNPIYYLLNLFRMPVLEGKMPSLQNYLVVLVACLIAWSIAFVLIKRHENRVIFYL